MNKVRRKGGGLLSTVHRGNSIWISEVDIGHESRDYFGIWLTIRLADRESER